MGRCFVIQPFDKGQFDKRYRDIIVPAVTDAGLEPYRVDEDPSATVLIDDIEAGIRASEICLADITKDNPNIWYEVGFALANDKPVVMICAEPRPTPSPFDIRHRHIIVYSVESASDFEKLRKDIATRLIAQIKKNETMQTIASLSPVKSSAGVSSYEMAALVTIMETRFSPDSSVIPREIQTEMRKAGYTDLAVTLALESLLRKGMIEYDTSNDGYNSYEVCRITDLGVKWLLDNQDRFIMQITNHNKKPTDVIAGADITDEDIPF